VTAVNPSARFLIPMAVSPVALVMYPRSRAVAPRSLSERAGSPSDRAPSVLSDGSVGLEGVGWDLVALRHRGEEWKRRLGKTVLVTDREDRYMCGRDRVFFRSSSDPHHHPWASLRAIQQSLSARSEAGSSEAVPPADGCPRCVRTIMGPSHTDTRVLSIETARIFPSRYIHLRYAGVPYRFVGDARRLNFPLLVRTATSIPEPARLILKLREFPAFLPFSLCCCASRPLERDTRRAKMLPLGLCPLFALLLWKLESAAGAVVNTRADIPTSPPNNSETLVPTLLSFSLEQDRWPGPSADLCTAFSLTVG